MKNVLTLLAAQGARSSTAGPFGPEYKTKYITFINSLLDIPTIPEYAQQTMSAHGHKDRRMIYCRSIAIDSARNKRRDAAFTTVIDAPALSPNHSTSVFQLNRQFVDLGGENKIILGETVNGMRPDFDADSSITGNVKVGVMPF